MDFFKTPPWDQLDAVEEAERAWLRRYEDNGSGRQAHMIRSKIQGFWEMRERRGWTSKLQREIAPRVEAFSGGIPEPRASEPSFGDWTRDGDE